MGKGKGYDSLKICCTPDWSTANLSLKKIIHLPQTEKSPIVSHIKHSLSSDPHQSLPLTTSLTHPIMSCLVPKCLAHRNASQESRQPRSQLDVMHWLIERVIKHSKIV